VLLTLFGSEICSSAQAQATCADPARTVFAPAPQAGDLLRSGKGAGHDQRVRGIRLLWRKFDADGCERSRRDGDGDGVSDALESACGSRRRSA
jgi:hypothetical protein